MPAPKIYTGVGNVIEVQRAGTVTTTFNKVTHIYHSPRKRDSIYFNVCPPEYKFTGRTTELELLHSAMQRNFDSRNSIASQITVVSGLGGIGKTQLVREYVNQNKSKYDDNVIWINGDNEKAIIEAFRMLVNDKLYICTVGANGAEKDIKSVVQDGYDYFSGKNILFVYDNVESMEDIRKFLLFGPNRANRRPYILITSRVQDWHIGIEVIRLAEWQHSEAFEFVSAILVNAHGNVEDINLLVKELQYFPLALRQATSYIFHKRDTISKYRAKYEKEKKQLLDSKLFQNSVDQYTETTFTTWNITIKSIEQDAQFGSLAMRILNTMAYFHADNIHRASLINLIDATTQSTSRGLGKYFIELVVSEIFSLPAISQSKRNDIVDILPVDKEDLLESAVSLLVKYSMISSQEGQMMLSIHRVVQDVIKVTLKVTDRERKILRNALFLIEKLMKRVQHTSHAMSVFLHSLEYPDLVREFYELPNTIMMNLIIDSMKEDAVIFENQFRKKFETILGLNHPISEKKSFHLRYVQAYRFSRHLTKNDTGHVMYEDLYKLRALEFGQDDVDTILVKFKIGQIFLRMGNVSGAFSVLEEANRQFEIKLGHAHPTTLSSEEIIAVSYCQTGLHSQALQILDVLYEKKTSLFGENDTKTLFTINAIGKVLFHQQKYTHALEVFQKICRNNNLDEEHETRFRAMENMAHVHTKLGNFDEAIQIYKEEYEKKMNKLGPSHPLTLTTLVDFGVTLLDQWKVTDSIEMFMKMITNCEFEEENSETLLICMKNLGLAYARLGDHKQAEKIYKDVLTKRIKIHGNNHPDSLSALNDIGELFLLQEMLSDALHIFEEIYEKRTDLGEENVVILASMYNIAHVLRKLGNNENSLELYKNVHMQKTRRLGEDHPDTLEVLLEIATLSDKMKRHTDALRIYETVYEKRMELGEEHLVIRIALKEIAQSYGRSGRYSEAFQMLNQIYTKSTVLGERHPATLCALIDIGLLYIEQRNHTKALRIFLDVYEKAMKISQTNEFVVISMRQLVVSHLCLGNYLQSWKLCREGLARNIIILEGNPLENVCEFIDTAIQLINNGKRTEAFLIFMDIYVHRISLGIANEYAIISGLRKKLLRLYVILSTIQFIQKHCK